MWLVVIASRGSVVEARREGRRVGRGLAGERWEGVAGEQGKVGGLGGREQATFTGVAKAEGGSGSDDDCRANDLCESVYQASRSLMVSLHGGAMGMANHESW